MNAPDLLGEIEALTQDADRLSGYARNATTPTNNVGWSSVDQIAESINLQTKALLLLVEQAQRIANAMPGNNS